MCSLPRPPEQCTRTIFNIMKKICIISSVHNVFDVRIFHKEASSLVLNGYDVCLIAQHAKNEIVNGVKIHSLPFAKSRFRRIVFLPIHVLKISLRKKVDAYHFHDPELLLVGLILKLLTNAVVVYDVHEDFPSTVFAREWLPRIGKNFLSKVTTSVESFFSKRFDAVITADPYLKKRFAEFHPRVIMLLNVPPKRKLIYPLMSNRNQSLVHIGSLSKSRGAWFLIEVMELLAQRGTNFHLDIFVKSTPNHVLKELSFQIQIKKLEDYITIFETVPYIEMLEKLGNYRLGLIPFLDLEKYRKNIATKMFDYMAAGVAVVASDLPPQRVVINSAGCGRLITPEDSKAFASAIHELLEDPEKTYTMGINGWKAIQNQYCWEQEEKKLFGLYRNLL